MSGKVRAPCSVEGCGRLSQARGVCRKHYNQLRRRGPLPPLPEIPLLLVVDQLSECITVAATGCIEWQGRQNTFGYGLGTHDGRTQVAHRVAYELVNGPIPDGQIVRHTCDNPPCCNPEHLILGTYADNTADMYERRRDRQHEKTSCVLTWDLVDIIRERYSGGESYRSIAAEIGFSPSTVWYAAKGRTWKDEHRPR